MGRTLGGESRRWRLLFSTILTVIASISLPVPVARANFGIHGSYAMESQTCAACHRTHASTSSIVWSDKGGEQRSALLLGTASTVSDFCFTCHGSAAAGAATNVVDGVYEAKDHGAAGAGLNGGAFGEHVVGENHHTYDGGSADAYGGDRGIAMTCGSCHDVHGSSNYRLLKDVVNGVKVGGYDKVGPGDYVPDPFVISNERGYPAGGWLLHDAGAAQVARYDPDYTRPMYAKAPGEDPARGISAWCRACHTTYHSPDAGTSSRYDAGDGFGDLLRHRHPVNVPLDAYLGARPLSVTRLVLPLAQELGSWTPAGSASDWMDCLTCHRAHGSDAVMTGFANVADSTDPQPDTGVGTVPPGTKNAFLRLDDRGVCEQCHNK
jgi:hypothetical protein